LARSGDDREYYELTDKPLGVTGEIAEDEAASTLKLELSPARQSGYDAIREIDGRPERLQSKGRRLTATSKRSQRVGGINCKHDWDAVILVLLDEHYEPTEIYEAVRHAVTGALSKPGSRAQRARVVGHQPVQEDRLTNLAEQDVLAESAGEVVLRLSAVVALLRHRGWSFNDES
jgi:hypothetical protein